jgi:hypothetical protein
LTGESQTIYADDVSLYTAKFVQNGERILVFADAGARVILFERDGTALQEFTNMPGDTLVFGTPEGFVYAAPQAGNASAATTIVAATTLGDTIATADLYVSPSSFNEMAVQDYQVFTTSPEVR